MFLHNCMSASMRTVSNLRRQFWQKSHPHEGVHPGKPKVTHLGFLEKTSKAKFIRFFTNNLQFFHKGHLILEGKFPGGCFSCAIWMPAKKKRDFHKWMCLNAGLCDNNHTSIGKQVSALGTWLLNLFQIQDSWTMLTTSLKAMKLHITW